MLPLAPCGAPTLEDMNRSLLCITVLLTAALSNATAQVASSKGEAAVFADGEYHGAEEFKKDAFDLLRFAFEREPGVWTRALDAPIGPRPPARVGVGALRATVVNHSTVLLQFDGINVLTDPIWSTRASPVQWAGPKRFVPPGIAFADLPAIDVVLISHDHYDHLDLPTVRRLHAAFNPLFIVGERQGELLREQGVTRIQELNWGQSAALPNGSKVWGQESRHWCGRSAFSRNTTLWLSYVLETRGGPIYFAGDTGFGAQFEASEKAFGPMRLALLPIGAYKPRWLTAYQHMEPCEAARAHLALAAAHSIAIHYGTFELADDGQTEPVTELARCLAVQQIPAASFTATPFGSGYDVPPLASSLYRLSP